MKYLITVSSLTAGSGLSRYVFSLCRILGAQNEVWVLTTHNGADTSYEREELKKISPDIQLISLGQEGKIGRYTASIRWIWKVRPDVIVNNYNAVTQYILPLIPKRIRVVHILHNDTDDFYRVGSIYGSHVAGWIAPTQGIADHFNQYTEQRFAPRVTVIPHGVEEANLLPRRNNVLEIIYAGVLYEHKGVKILPEVIHRLMQAGVKLHFTIVGGGIEQDWLQDEFRKELENGTVTMTGVVNHARVYELFSQADVFLYPTHLDAFGLVIAEAMMNGVVPVVTLLKGVTDNLITEGEDGYLLAQDDVKSFVDRIVRLDKDRTMLAQLCEAAHQRADTMLSIHRMQHNYLNYFNTL